MPELPEVETMRRGIAPCIGMRIDAIEVIASPRRPISITPRGTALQKRLCGVKITGTNRAGKRVIVLLDTGDRLVFEPRMTGLVLLADPPTAEHLRFRLRLSSVANGNRTQNRVAARARQGLNGNSASRTEDSVPSVLPDAIELLFWDRRGLGSVRLMTEVEFGRAFSSDRLGPDALGATANMLSERLGESRRAIKVALLDQRAVAGIGNLYASEILYRARIHPGMACRRLRPADWQRIAATTRRILTAAIRYEGSTLSDGTYRNALNQTGTYQNHHQVYDRAGQRCARCRDQVVRRIVQAQRATFFCPGCQVKSR